MNDCLILNRNNDDSHYNIIIIIITFKGYIFPDQMLGNMYDTPHNFSSKPADVISGSIAPVISRCTETLIKPDFTRSEAAERSTLREEIKKKLLPYRTIDRDPWDVLGTGELLHRGSATR